MLLQLRSVLNNSFTTRRCCEERYLPRHSVRPSVCHTRVLSNR